MNLLFTGSFPAWLALILFLLLAGGTLVIYHRQALAPPWNFILPGLRILVLGLLCLCLLQPVLSRSLTQTVRGRIALIVDDSGSMGIADTYSPAEQVATAWSLGLFPREERSLIFDRLEAEGDVFRDKLTSLMTGVEKVRLLLAEESPSPSLVSQRLQQQTEANQNILQAGQQMLETLESVPEQVDYLSDKMLAEDIRGRLTYERFDNIGGGELKDLEAAENFPGGPDGGGLLREFRMPANAGEHYGARIRAVLSPPVSGQYTFYISADDQAALYMSADTDGRSLRRIAFVPAWVEPGQTDRYPEQTSAAVLLEKGKDYYLEARVKENTGRDHCSVGWQRPDGRREMPIPGTYFSPVGSTVAYRRFRRDYVAALASFSEGLARLSEAADRFERVGSLEAGRRLQTLDKVYRETFLPLAEAWDQILERLPLLQKRADEVLAGTSLASVDAGVNKLTGMSRFDLAWYQLKKGDLKRSRLQRLGDVDVFLLGEPPRAVNVNHPGKKQLRAFRHSTRLGSVAYDVLMSYGNRPVSAVIVMTDGNNNAGRDLSETARVFEEQKVPLFGVGFGLPAPPDDIAIDSVSAPATSFKGDQLVFTAVLRRHGYTGHPIRLLVRSGAEILHTQVVPPGKEEMVAVDLRFAEERTGYRHYVVEAEPLSGEVLQNNNRRSVSVNILTDPIRALIVDEFPRWETRYLKMMLEKDVRVDVQAVFSGSGKTRRSTEPWDALFTREALFGLDVLVLGDVPRTAFSDRQLINIQQFVEDRAGCVLVVAGPHHMPRAYRESVLEDIFPFRIEPEPAVPGDNGPASHRQIPLLLSESGKQASPVQIAPSFKGNEHLWERLPAMNWVADGIHPAANGDVLVMTDDRESPVILMGQAGLGRVLMLGTDSLWRWRYRTGGRFHQRLWGQIFLWATVGRTTGSDEHVKLMTERAEYSPGETVLLKARILGVDKQPLKNGTAAANIVNANGRTIKRVPFTYLENSGGEYRAQVRGLPEGKYTVVPSILELEGVEVSADYPFEIRDLPTSEYVELALNDAALSILTREHVTFLEAGKLLERIPRLAITETRRSDIEIWDTGWLLLLVTGLLGIEWRLRKRLNKL